MYLSFLQSVSVASQKTRNHSRYFRQRKTGWKELVTKVLKVLKSKGKSQGPLERRKGKGLLAPPTSLWLPSAALGHPQWWLLLPGYHRKRKQLFSFSKLLILVPVPRMTEPNRTHLARCLGEPAIGCQHRQYGGWPAGAVWSWKPAAATQRAEKVITTLTVSVVFSYICV